VVYWTCTGKFQDDTRKGVNKMKAMFQYARYALSALATLAFGLPVN
jgi:hypothetical protein